MECVYNESAPYPAQWLRNLIEARSIRAGVVSERKIQDLEARDVQGRTFHAFAGIGGWAEALRLAQWPDEVPVWTGSCPCQPFSHAGGNRGFADERHLWPVWFRLIEECRPSVLFGEQVASAGGCRWFDRVACDLERAGYAVGAADLCAASVGAPHIRQRLWFVAYSDEDGWAEQRAAWLHAQGSPRNHPARRGETGAMGDPHRSATREHSGELQGHEGQHEERRTDRSDAPQHPGPAHPWTNAEWAECSDGKRRPIESGIAPLAHGIPARVGRLRAYGNAIVPQVAAEFIKAFIATQEERNR